MALVVGGWKIFKASLCCHYFIPYFIYVYHFKCVEIINVDESLLLALSLSLRAFSQQHTTHHITKIHDGIRLSFALPFIRTTTHTLHISLFFCSVFLPVDCRITFFISQYQRIRMRHPQFKSNGCRKRNKSEMK